MTPNPDPPRSFQGRMGRALLVAAALSVGWTVAAGCSSDPDVERHARALERLHGGLAADLDRLLLRWSAAQDEGNVHQQMVAEAWVRQKLRDPEAVFAVRVGLALTEEEILATCAAAAGFTGESSLGTDLVRLLRHADPAVRANAVLGAVLLGGAGCPLETAAPLLRDEDAGVRRHAATLVGRVLLKSAAAPGYAEAMLAYLDALSDPDPQVRAHVAEGLGRLGDPQASTHLVRAGLRDPVPAVRYTSALALATLKPASEVDALVEFGEAEFNPHVKKAISAALHAITDQDISDFAEWKKAVADWRRQRNPPPAPAPAPEPPTPTTPTPPAGGPKS